MKRSILLSLAIIPILFSCNKNDKGFDDPFPDDDYPVIGMDEGAEDRKIVSILSDDDKKLVEDWYNNYNESDEEITYHEIDSQIRDYTLAFANKYKAGYDASNAMVHNVSKIYKLKKGKDASAFDYFATEKTVNAKYKYDFGENVVEDLKSFDYHSFAIRQGKEQKVTTTSKKNGNVFINITNYQKDKDAKAKKLVDKEEWGTTITDYYPTSQKEFRLHPSLTSDLVGFDKDGHVVLVNAHQDPYEDGYYKLPDGRKFVAVQKDLIVTKLKLVKDITNHYLIDTVRTYKEISITSKEVQPNIPPTELSKPIIIHFEEDKHTFGNTTQSKPSEIEEIPESATLLEDK